MTAHVCASCATPVPAVDWQLEGIACGCALDNPLERAATKYAGATPEQWAAFTETARNAFREVTHDVLAAALDVDDLARVVGHAKAHTIRDHLLGTDPAA